MSKLRLNLLFLVFEVVLLGLSPCGGGSVVLPDHKLPDTKLWSERKNNTKDEYAVLIGRYGQPDSILTTENDSPKPLVSTRIARYQSAHLKIALAPVGCVAAYEKALGIIADSSRYPGVAEFEMRSMKRCVPSSDAGWTIVGYINSSDNMAISAELAELFLEKIKEKRTAEPVVDAQEDPIKQTPKKRKTEQKKADKRLGLLEEEMKRDEEATQERMRIRATCEIVYESTANKRMSDLTVKESQQVQALSYTRALFAALSFKSCETFGGHRASSNILSPTGQ
jgi:hypothetical protein